jgi:signal transduction histidine kinase
MDFNLVTNIETCHQYISEAPMSLVYYSHFMSIGFALIFGSYIFFKNKSALINKVFFAFTIIFSLWLIDDFIQWIGVDSGVLMFNWAIVLIFDVLFYILCLYFVYLFVDKKDISFSKKVIFGLILLPIILWTPTNLYLPKFDDVLCVPVENKFYLNYVYFAELLFSFWIIILSIVRYRKAENKNIKKQIMLLTTGISLFLLLFFAGGYVSEYVYNLGYTWGYNIELYSFFGLSLFLGFLGYLIVEFKMFNIKLLKAQALMVALAALIGALFFYVTEAGGKILILTNLALVVGFGYMLVKSVKKEVEQKEHLEIANAEISKRGEELQKINKELKVAYTKLEELDQAKEEFTSLASHQLKNAPTAIKSSLGMFLEGAYGKIPDNQLEVLININKANERQIDLTKDLLKIIKMESKKVKLDFQKERVEDICQRVYDNLSAMAKEKNLSFKYEKPEQSLPELLLDKDKVFDSIFNFVDNAVKYTPQGSITIKAEIAPASNYKPLNAEDLEIEKARGSILGSVVRVTISDTGNGISKENLSKLFVKFSRTDKAGSNSGGTGLGLYLVKLMIEAHGGRTWAQSDGEGKGSRFIMELPVETPKEILEQNKQ